MKRHGVIAILFVSSIAFAQSPDRDAFALRCGIAQASNADSKLLLRTDGAWQRPKEGVVEAASGEHVRVWHERNWLLEWTSPNAGESPVLYCFGPKKKLKFSSEGSAKPAYKKLEQLPFWGFLKE